MAITALASFWIRLTPAAAAEPFRVYYIGNSVTDYFETLTRILRRVNPKISKPVLLIPVGHVMFELAKIDPGFGLVFWY